MKTLIVALTSSVVLMANAKTVYWTGAVSDKWDHTDLNFVDAAGNRVAFADKDEVVFDDAHLTKDQEVWISNDGSNPSPTTITVDTFRNLKFVTKDFGSFISWDLRTITKRGTGSLVFDAFVAANNDTRIMAGPKYFYIQGGKVEFAQRWQFRYGDGLKSNIEISSGATLQFDRAAPYECGTTAYMSERGLNVVVQPGGRFIVKEATGEVCHFGNMTFGDADAFDFSEWKGWNSWGWAYGIFTVKKVTFGNGNGSVKPYSWMKAGTADATRARLMLHPDLATEFCVSNVTGDASADFSTDFLFADYLNNYAPNVTTVPAGFVKSGPGTMKLTTTQGADGKNVLPLSTFSGDVDVREGVLSIGPDNQISTRIVSGNSVKGAPTYLGRMDLNDDRMVTVRKDARLHFTDSYPLGSCDDAWENNASSITNDFLVGTFCFDGGNLAIKNTQSIALPSLTFKNGGTVTPGYGSDGSGRVKFFDTLAVKKTETGDNTPFEWKMDMTHAASVAQRSSQGIALNGYPENTFEIDDLTDDVRPDATFEVPFYISYAYFRCDTPNGNHELSDWAFGFTKTGSGTLRYTAGSILVANAAETSKSRISYRTYNGDTKVNAGALQMDGDISLSDTVRVASGAFLSGTGTVNNVVLEAGSGLRASALQSEPLKVNGGLDIGANLVVDIVLPSESPRSSVKAKVVAVEGSVVGVENLATATVKVNGSTAADMRLVYRDGLLQAKYIRGMAIILR